MTLGYYMASEDIRAGQFVKMNQGEEGERRVDVCRFRDDLPIGIALTEAIAGNPVIIQVLNTMDALADAFTLARMEINHIQCRCIDSDRNQDSDKNQKDNIFMIAGE